MPHLVEIMTQITPDSPANSIVLRKSARLDAAVETFFKTIKAELIRRQSWGTRRQAEMAIFQYINSF